MIVFKQIPRFLLCNDRRRYGGDPTVYESSPYLFSTPRGSGKFFRRPSAARLHRLAGLRAVLAQLPSLHDPGKCRGCDWAEVSLSLHASSPYRLPTGILKPVQIAPLTLMAHRFPGLTHRNAPEEMCIQFSRYRRAAVPAALK